VIAMKLALLEDAAYGLSWVLDEPMARASHALADGGRVWLVDPTDEPDALERALALGEPVSVLQLLDRHRRDCSAIANRLGVPLERVPKALPESPFEVVPLIANALWHEVALWWPAHRALIVPEAIGTAEGFAPGPAGAGVHIGLRLRPPRTLAAYVPEHLLAGHGPPVHGSDAAAAVRESLERSRTDLPSALVRTVKLIASGMRS
jgi:hypothetical protein